MNVLHLVIPVLFYTTFCLTFVIFFYMKTLEINESIPKNDFLQIVGNLFNYLGSASTSQKCLELQEQLLFNMHHNNYLEVRLSFIYINKIF